ncbi:Tim44 domain-containing protein [Litchfieldella rifensis]|uniref:Tim44 domain-containing protein n=1 Tax=Litchfieldella rifensis TaxID=762643 RepID=A0ABV7LP69_9GAMM
MRNLIIMLLVGMMGLSLAIDHAEARRLGGGKSFGSFSRSTETAPTRSASPTSGQQQAGARPPSRARGMMGGLLAGGLLAALFFGGAFDELRLLDILLIAGLAFLAWRFLARRRPAMAGRHDDRPDMAASRMPPLPFQTAGHLGGNDGFASLPSWFDKERFLGDAKEHFMNLQRAWDNNDFSSIQEYVTPELYNLLREERQHHPANNRTDIVRLFAELGDVREYDKTADATVIFHGIIEENGAHNEFNETWHLVRDMRSGAPWHIQGIEQNPGT